MQGVLLNAEFYNGSSGDGLFARIARDIEKQGFSINPHALPDNLIRCLAHYQSHMERSAFHMAGVGRADGFFRDRKVRNDEISWITGQSLAGRQWLKWCSELQQYLNHRLFLGLFSFESHFAHYAPKAFYQKHFDAFRGDSNRVLSLIVYLNKDWNDGEGGELVIYRGDSDVEGIRVLPNWGTIVVFLSEEFPHEVLPAKRDRYSIAGWYRLNSSTFGHVDLAR